MLPGAVDDGASIGKEISAAGYRGSTNLGNVGSYGYYWSSSLSTGSPSGAWSVYFDPGFYYRNYNDRCSGLSVRPVSE